MHPAGCHCRVERHPLGRRRLLRHPDDRRRLVSGDLDVPLEHSALVYRVVQESVRNVLRHADASNLSVAIAGDRETVTATVVDNGRGFDTIAATGDEHLGLRLLSDLTADAGAGLTISSHPGEGTTILLEVPR